MSVWSGAVSIRRSPAGGAGQSRRGRKSGASWLLEACTPAGAVGIFPFLAVGPEIPRNKGHSAAFASRHRTSEARHVRGFAGRFRDFWPRAARSAAPVRVGTSSAFAGWKPFGGVHASARLPVIARAALLCPLTCVFISPIMYRSLAVAGTHRFSQSPALGALYADR